MIKRTITVPKNKEECKNVLSCSDCDMAFWDNCLEVLDSLIEMFEEE